MLLTGERLIFRGVKPLLRLGTTARNLAFDNPLMDMPLVGKVLGATMGSLPALRVPQELAVVPPDPWPGDPQHGRMMLAGVFHFAGQTVAKESLAWRPAVASPEWCAELHSFEWLRNLRSVSGDRARRMAREMVSSWIEQYPKYDEFAWRADIMGARLKAWISFHDFFCASADDAFRQSYFESLTRQTRFLARALPANLSGIRLMVALRGLAFAGMAIEDADDYLEEAFKGILYQIQEQILPDGGHISRNPQTTFEFFQCLVDLRAALIAAKLEMPEEVQHAIDKMAPAIKFFRHGDGGIAQFNGAQAGNAHLVDTTLMHSGARGKAMKSLPHTGYERITQGRSSLIMDTGLPLVSTYSDRAHAGLLSFEYSYGRDRVIVNCGTSGVAGTWRRVLRSTLAHSALTVDNRNSCQFDETGLLSSRPSVRAKRQEDENVAMIDASHGGYIPRFGLIHRRCIRLQDEGEVLQGEEQLAGKSGVPYAVRFHLHPDIKASFANGGSDIILRAKSGMTWTFNALEAKLGLEESVYVSSDEQPQECQQIVLTGQTVSSLTTITWVLRH